MVYAFSPSRAGEHARNFFGSWNGKLVCDDFAGYKAGFEKGMIEIGCMAHARRKLFDLHVANKSQLADQALYSIGGLYEVERQVRDVSDEDRWRLRQEKAAPVIKALHEWMLAQRDLVPNGSATAKALDYSLKRWVTLTRYLDDGAAPIDNNAVEARSDHGHLDARTGCFIALNPSLLGEANCLEGAERAERMFDAIVDQGARLPSQRRFEARRRSQIHGVKVSAKLLADIHRLLY